MFGSADGLIDDVNDGEEEVEGDKEGRFEGWMGSKRVLDIFNEFVRFLGCRRCMDGSLEVWETVFLRLKFWVNE